VARVVAFIPDLLFGSKVQGMLAQAGHDVALVASADAAPGALTGADVLLVDLVSAGAAGVALLETLRAQGALDGVPTLATYAHVDAGTRRRAHDAGFDAVVPRSRLMRAGADLLSELAAA
jgi:CheY-like chemotaxis protein